MVYSPYKNIYIETACSYAYKANAFRLGQGPTPYSGVRNNPAPQRAEHIQSWTETSQHLRKPLQELYMDFGAPSRFTLGEEARRAVLTSTLET